jgi:hypothetical protein
MATPTSRQLGFEKATKVIAIDFPAVVRRNFRQRD